MVYVYWIIVLLPKYRTGSGRIWFGVDEPVQIIHMSHIYYTRRTSSQQTQLVSTVTQRALTLSSQDNKNRKLAKGPLEPIAAFSRS